MLLRLENRYREAQPYVLELYRQGCFRREYLLTTGRAENHGLLTGGDDKYLDVCRSGVPNDPLPLLNRVSVEQFVANPTPALRLLEANLARAPDLIEAQARRGWLLLTAGTDDEFLSWNRSLSRSADEHPLVWVARGLYTRSHGDQHGAVRCLLQAIELDPFNRQAFYHLAQLFRDLGEIPSAEACARRANLLERFESVLGAPPTTLEQLHDAVEIAESLQRPWEALGWAHEAVRLFPDDRSSAEMVVRLKSEVSSQMSLCAITRDSDWNIRPAKYPLPDWASLIVKDRAQPASTSGGGAVRFADRAKSLGLNFLFHNGADPASGTAYMFELSGGGVGVLDFDGDGWPDLYLTQGCHWPVNDRQTKDLDRLFRNVRGERFEDVTTAAGLVENGLSQSASIGDINADGFQDVYVGNVGANRLWLNNGDGTFHDATESAGVAGNDWTASAAFGDLNGDGLQDLYVVNYLSGPDVYTRKCFHPVGGDRVPVQCSPTLFPAAEDRLYQNLGDGRFADVTNESGIVAPNGKGMAVVLADFDGSRRLNVFVANDTTACFYFMNRVDQPGGPLQFVEQGVQIGLAYDDAGNAKSSMGTATGDANRDGRLDLFVTNFSRELNNLYLQQPGDVWVDSIRESGLAEPGYALMGWGTQFLDGNLDGLDDLFVANGDLYPTSNPYQMPQHYFHNRGNGRFTLAAPESLGPYFTHSWLGRAVARLDMNRDGLADLAVTHVDSPFALLVNESPRHGRFLSVRLRGVVSDREAIGATVRVTAKGQTWSRQLVGGDGFAVSNERVLTFGLGETESIDSISVAWPAGTDDVFQEAVPTDSELLIVEGSRRIVFLNRNP
ncbi:MAG: VCBS repeat-containing protein [Planctomycetaceae bacterium]|nr:VCBS repeat-containing protein [Planctomycetaceae bacterium]